jgi:Spy/CpxP family protein refolding chaperone
MKLTRKGFLGLAIAAAVVMAAAAIPVLGQGWGNGHHPDRHHGRTMDRIMERLELTDEQRAEVEAMMSERHDAMEANIDELRAARGALFDAIHAAEFNETAIRDAAAAVATIEADLAVERGLGYQDFRKILTPDQQAEFEEMQKSMRAYHWEYEGGHGGYGPGPHGPKGR